jgi:CSLREA domain-containing protein
MNSRHLSAVSPVRRDLFACLTALCLSTGMAHAETFSNTQAITINDQAIAGPYPSTIAVNVTNPSFVTRVEVTLNGFSHTAPDDVDIILVGPRGQRVILMSDAGGDNPGVTNLNLTFDTAATMPIPDATAPATGTFLSANYVNSITGSETDIFPAPGPGTLTNATADLGIFNSNPNGVWSLYVVDDSGGGTGSISGGWTLKLTVPRTFTVTKTADTNDGLCDADCSLREAVTLAQQVGQLIVFSPLFNTTQTIDLKTALPILSRSISIQGPGADLLTVRRDVNAATNFRIFHVKGPAGVVNAFSISGLTISGGTGINKGDDFGGGILSESSLILNNVNVSGNTAGSGGGVSLVSFNSATIVNGYFMGCTFSNNSSTDPGFGGGGIYFQGDRGELLLRSSTVSGNRSVGRGAGIINLSTRGSSELSISSSTITGNVSLSANASTATGGVDTYASGLFFGGMVSATTKLYNTIIAGNTPTNLAAAALNGGGAATFETFGFNLSDNYNGVLTPLSSDITAPARLAPLALGGGSTPTHALRADSPALNAGDSGSSTDQRGLPRPVGIADIGAVEMQGPLVVSNANDTGTGSLRQALIDANANGIGLDDIVFASPFFNFTTFRTITLQSALPDITSALTMNGPNALLVTRSASAPEFPIFKIVQGLGNGVAISGMTLTNGRGARGGAIFSESRLVLTNVQFFDNQTNGSGIGGRGGAIGLIAADGVFNACTFSGNGFNDDGAVYFQGGGNTLRVLNSTFSENRFGGIYNFSQLGSFSRLDITNSTFANNDDFAIGTVTNFAGSTATTTLRNTIVSSDLIPGPFQLLSLAGAGGGPALIVSRGFNLSSDAGSGFLTASGDKINTNAGLGEFGFWGGTVVPTIALLPGSAALDAGNNGGSGALVDQRGAGFARTINLPNVPNAAGGDGTDIGAFEAQSDLDFVFKNGFE